MNSIDDKNQITEHRLIEQEQQLHHTRRKKLIIIIIGAGVICLLLLSATAAIYQQPLIQTYEQTQPEPLEPIPDYYINCLPLVSPEYDKIKLKTVQSLSAPAPLDPATSTFTLDITHPDSKRQRDWEFWDRNPQLYYPFAQLIRPINNSILLKNNIPSKYWFNIKISIVNKLISPKALNPQASTHLQSFTQLGRYRRINSISGNAKTQYETTLHALQYRKFMLRIGYHDVSPSNHHEYIRGDIFGRFFENDLEYHIGRAQLDSFIEDLITAYDLEAVYTIWLARYQLADAAYNFILGRDYGDKRSKADVKFYIENDRRIEALANEYHRVHPQLGPLLLGPKIDLDSIYGGE